MLSKSIFFTVDDEFNLNDVAKMLKEFATDKLLVLSLDYPLESYIDTVHDYDVTAFISKIQEGYFDTYTLSDIQIKRLKNETAGNLDFSRSICFIVEDIDDIEKFIKLDWFWFSALIIENNDITSGFFYSEAIDSMTIIVDFDPEFGFEEFIIDYSKKNNKAFPDK